jgi:hypothetical protein
MKKSYNNIITALFILILASVMVLVIVISVSSSSSDKNYFYQDKRASAVSLYNQIMGVSDENYPQTPEETVNIYFAGYHLLYGNMIKDTEIIPEILIQQRMLLSSELIETNTLEAQEQNLTEALDDFKEKNVYITFIETKPAIYDDIENACIRVHQIWSNMEEVNFNYYLKKDTLGKWKIIRWEIAQDDEE